MYKVIIDNREYPFQSLDNAMLVYGEAFKKCNKIKVVDEHGKILCKKGDF